MAKATIYHNPRCTKSRQTLELLRQQGIEPEIVEYLKTRPDQKTLRLLLKQLKMQPNQLLRKKDYRELGLPATEDPDELISQMANHPEIIERPIVVIGHRAVLGRPPENVLEII